MPEDFKSVELDLAKVAENFQLKEISDADWKLIQNLGLPGTEQLSAAGANPSKEVILEFVRSFLTPSLKT